MHPAPPARLRSALLFLLPALLVPGCIADPPLEEEELPPPTVGQPPPVQTTLEAPVILELAAGDAQVLLRWSTAPGSAFDAYEVRATGSSPAMAPVTVREHEARLTGLVPGQAYTFTVTGRTSSGGEATSQASLPATPYLGSCRTLKGTQPDATSGVHTLTLGGVQQPVYCDMTHDGGGWTLVLHSTFDDSAPPPSDLTQGIADWRSAGIGRVADFEGHSSAPLYVMALDSWRALAETASTLRFESDASPALAQLQGMRMAANFGLSGSNTTEVNQKLCGTSPGCFLNFAPPFSTTDSGTSGSACAQVHRNIGWWYEGCHLYHPFMTDTRGNFSGFSADPTTNHWTWWVR